jgi:hypothetical protein
VNTGVNGTVLPAWTRIVFVLLVIVLALNGANMLLRPEAWYHSIPSVPHTGPFNPHFVRDIGSAYLAAAVGVALPVWRGAWLVPGVSVALVFLGAHAAVHVVEAFQGHTSAAHSGVLDIAGVYALPLVVLVVFVAAMRRTANGGS